MTIEQVNTVDFYWENPKSGEPTLIIVDHLDWTDTLGHIDLLQAKINAYLQYIEGGQLAEEHPSAIDRKVVIMVIASATLNSRAEEFYAYTSRVLDAAGYQFAFQSLDDFLAHGALDVGPVRGDQSTLWRTDR